MNQKAQMQIAAAILLVIVVCAIVVAIFMLPLGTGYKVKISGSATYSSFPSSWYVSFSGSSQEKDSYIFATQPGLWWWDTGGIVIEVIMGSYTADNNIGGVSSWLGGSKTWSVDLRHVEPGTYSGTINLYEIQGGFFGIGGDKVLKTSAYFTTTISDTEP